MSTRGLYGFHKNGIDKLTYNHLDSYPDWLGKKIVEFCKCAGRDGMNSLFDHIELVSEDAKPTPKQIEYCMEHDLGVDGGDWGWTLCPNQGCPENWLPFIDTGAAAKAAGTSRSVVLDHVKNKVKPQNKRFSYVRDWDGKVGRLVDLNVQMICLETDTIYHSYDEICAAIWSDGYGETRKEIVQKVGDAIRHGCPAFDMHWANRENFEERKEAYMEEKRLCARPVIELTTMREYADVHDALKFGSRYVDWKKIVAICDAKGEPTSEATRWRGERWFWKDDWNKNIKLKSGERIKDMQPVICYERGRCDYSVLELTRWYGFDHKSLLNSGKKGIVFDGLTWRLLRYDVDFEKRLKETPLICRETGKTFDTLSDLLDLLEREHECCAYDRPCHMYDLQRAIEGGREYKGFHFEYMVPPSVSGER